MEPQNRFVAEERRLNRLGVRPHAAVLFLVRCFTWWMVECKVWNVVNNLAWMTPERIGGLDWFIQRIPRSGDGTGRHDSYFHFQDGVHTIRVRSRRFAFRFAQMYVGSIQDTYVNFRSWYFRSKSGRTYAEASRLTRIDRGMLEHSTPYPVAPPPAVVAPPAVVMPIRAPDDPPGALENGALETDNDRDEQGLQRQVSDESD